MSQLLASLVDLTSLRDHDALDRRLLQLLAQALPRCDISLYRCVGDPAAPRLLRQAHLTAGQQGQVDAPWTAVDDLIALADLPVHQAAFLADAPLADLPNPPRGRAAALHVYPVSVRQLRVALIEVWSDEPLNVALQAWAAGLVALYRNQLALLDYSECDTLTGLLNRKTFDDQFNKCMAADTAERVRAQGSERRAASATACHWLGVVDIDHFKRVNDGFGHLIGDEVLLLVARILRSSFRHGDRLYRFGGEEFVVLLRAPLRDDALKAFERFRRDMAAFRFPQVGHVTASVGFTELRAVDTPTAAFERADRAVYHAKGHGRDRVDCHEALIEAGVFESVDKVGEVELF